MATISVGVRILLLMAQIESVVRSMSKAIRYIFFILRWLCIIIVIEYKWVSDRIAVARSKRVRLAEKGVRRHTESSLLAARCREECPYLPLLD